MSIYVIGINYKTAAIVLREKAYFALDKLTLYLQDLLASHIAQEAVLLSTCNRSELYCETRDISAAKQWFAAQTHLSSAECDEIIYDYQDEKAIAHIMEVACGLDSMVLGEPQILGQLKDAFAESLSAGAVSSLFHRIFQQVFAIAKEVRTVTAIGACPVSVASAAIHFAKTQVAHFAETRITLVGAGDTTALLLRYLSPQIKTPLMLVNRSIEKAMQLAKQTTANIYSLDQLDQALLHADVVFTATSSPLPVIKKALVETVMQKRAEKPLIFIDMAVPRDVDLAVKEISQVSYFCIDDLKAIIENNRQGREHAANKAHEIICKKSAALIAEIQASEKVSHTIRVYREQIERLCRAELIKAKQQLHQGKEAQEVLDHFAHTFVKKLLHAPSIQLRQAAASGDADLLQFATQLFAIRDHEIEIV